MAAVVEHRGHHLGACQLRRSHLQVGTLSGRCLARSQTEALLSWTEQRGVLGLKAFEAGPNRMLGLWFSTWPRGEGRVDPVRAYLDAAIDRLTSAVS